MDQNTCFAYLNMELPDDIRRLKEAGYYDAAIARIDACLAEDWTASQNQPLHPQGALPGKPHPPWRGRMAAGSAGAPGNFAPSAAGLHSHRRAAAEPAASRPAELYRRGVRRTGRCRADGLALCGRAEALYLPRRRNAGGYPSRPCRPSAGPARPGAQLGSF